MGARPCPSTSSASRKSHSVSMLTEAAKSMTMPRLSLPSTRPCPMSTSYRVPAHRNHPRLVAGQLGRTQERHLGAVAPRLLGDGVAVRGDDEAGQARGLARGGDGVTDERERAQAAEVLAGQTLGAAAGRDHAEHVRRGHAQTFTQRRSRDARRAASMTLIVPSPSQPSQRGGAPPITARKCFASSTYMSFSWPVEGYTSQRAARGS